jgi:phosphatidylglycerol---prolipoprotein diacylglyceryl transferase
MNTVFYINIDPVIFRIGPLAVGWYGLMVALAVITVVGWVAWQAKKTKLISSDTIFTGALIGIPAGIVFSKVVHVIDKWGYYMQNPGDILSGEGLTIWGAVLGAAIGVWIYSKFNRTFRFTLLADLIAPGIILSQAVGRVGCTFNGCCYGLESHSSLAVIYTNTPYAPAGIPVLPTQIYEIFFDLAVFGLLLLLRKRLQPEGSLFTLYFALYAAWRFAIDFIRDGEPFLGLPMHEAQFIGLVVMFITIPLLIGRTRWVGKGGPAKPAEPIQVSSLDSSTRE